MGGDTMQARLYHSNYGLVVTQHADGTVDWYSFKFADPYADKLLLGAHDLTIQWGAGPNGEPVVTDGSLVSKLVEGGR